MMPGQWPDVQCAGRPPPRSARAVCGHQRLSLVGGEVFDRFAQRDAGYPWHPGYEPAEYLIRLPLAHLTKHPADRLADEEARIAQHTVCDIGEHAEVAVVVRRVPQRHQKAEQTGAAYPHVVVCAPPAVRDLDLGMTQQEPAGDIAGEYVDQRPGTAVTDQLLEQVDVRGGQSGTWLASCSGRLTGPSLPHGPCCIDVLLSI